MAMIDVFNDWALDEVQEFFESIRQVYPLPDRLIARMFGINL